MKGGSERNVCARAPWPSLRPLYQCASLACIVPDADCSTNYNRAGVLLQSICQPLIPLNHRSSMRTRLRVSWARRPPGAATRRRRARPGTPSPAAAAPRRTPGPPPAARAPPPPAGAHTGLRTFWRPRGPDARAPLVGGDALRSLQPVYAFFAVAVKRASAAARLLFAHTSSLALREHHTSITPLQTQPELARSLVSRKIL
jgi:hypothetical protein